MMATSRRGGAPALILALFLALGSVLLGAVTVAAASNAAAEREYRRSQALALAEAGIAEARAGLPSHGPKDLGAGKYGWTADGPGGERLITARGEVASVSGAIVTRTVRARLKRARTGWTIRAWEEGP
jgi:hypothetical protein